MKCHSFIVLILPFVCIDCKSINDSDVKNVTKRESVHELFPDWVPFKNKHGDELGEFVPVEIKKPKKRLALPRNYVLKSFADADGEDYFGEAPTGEEYEWADASNMTDVGAVLGILTKHHPKGRKETVTKRPVKKSKEVKKSVDYPEEEYVNSEEVKRAKILDSVDKLKELHSLEQKMISENMKEEAMHTEERARDIERAVGDAYQKYYKPKSSKYEYEEYDDNSSFKDKYKMNNVFKATPTPTTTKKVVTTDKSTTVRTVAPDTGKLSVFRNPLVYMVYEDSDESSTTATTISTTALSAESTEESSTRMENRTTSTAKTTTSTPKATTTTTTGKSKIRSEKALLENITVITEKAPIESERISLVPQDSELREGEPTLFFPKKRKSRRRKIDSKSDYYKTTAGMQAAVNDTSGSGSSYTPSETKFTAPPKIDPSSAEAKVTPFVSSEHTDSQEVTGPSAAAVGPSADATGPSADASGPSAKTLEPSATGPTAPATEPAQASNHQETKIVDTDRENEQGGMTEHHAERHSDHGESGRKGYSGESKHTKTTKGHHDKEDHLGKYHDHGGHEEDHHDEKKHYGSHHHQENGKKHAEYEESGKHSKGHSTKGSHDIHKKEEYEKNVEFFEEEGDSFEEEKHGGHKEDGGHKKAGSFHDDKSSAGFVGGRKGDSGHHLKAGHHKVFKGHASAGGHDEHGKKVVGKVAAGHGEGHKKWIYHHGRPAHDAQLRVIDRRHDHTRHGAQYYG